MSDPIDRDEQRNEIALFKYTLILPLLRGEYPPGGKGRLREQIAAGRYEIPNSSRTTVSVPTLARWERIYRNEGFAGLKPKPRSDRGQLRALSAETLDRAETLKREQPRRSTRTLVAMLSQDQTNPIPEESISPRTLRRHLALRNATAVQLLHPQRPKPYQRFERNHFGDLWQGDAMHGPRLPNPAKPDKKRQATRLRRWQKIVQESFKQCGRSILPKISPPVSFEEVLALGQACTLKYIFWENESRPLPQKLGMRPPKTGYRIIIVLGPEGGFTRQEVEKAKGCSFEVIGLGPRILRAETATLAACTLMQYLYGDLG